MPGKILVADDSPNIREILKLSLETDGYTVVLAEDGDQALAMVEQEKPDLVIMDIMMPRVNGFQVCRRLKGDRATHDLPVIMLTAKSGWAGSAGPARPAASCRSTATGRRAARRARS